MVILLDSSIAAHRAQHKDVETDFFFFYQFCVFLIRLSWMAFAEVQTMPSSAGREEDEGISRHFQDGCKATRAELPFLIRASQGSIIYTISVSFHS